MMPGTPQRPDVLGIDDGWQRSTSVLDPVPGRPNWGSTLEWPA
jgi:hypothetical protein